MLSRGNSGANKNLSRCNSDDTVVIRFIGSVLVGKSETEDAQSDGKAAPASGFSILADDDLKEISTSKANQSNFCRFGDENGLFEPTITTRDVMAEINNMFGMPLDL